MKQAALRAGLIAALLATSSVFLQDASRAHGGAYRGPGSTVPPGGGSGGAPPGGLTKAPADMVPSTGGGPSGGGGGGGGTPTAGGTSKAGASGQAVSTAAPTTPAPGLAVSSENDWTQWWELNKDLYLDLKSRLYAFDIQPGSDKAFLGEWPVSVHRDNLRPTDGQIHDEVVPALLAALKVESHNEIITGCLIALAKTGRTESDATAREFERAFLPFLADPNQEIAETAALSLGILGHDTGVPTLLDLLLDTERGQELTGRTEVHYRTRAFAAYGLSMVGDRTEDEATRSRIVAALFDVLDERDMATKDLAVACLVALGRTSLETIELDSAAGPRESWPRHSCRVAQIDGVLDVLGARDVSYLVRAHAPATLVELTDDLPDKVRGPVVETLSRAFVERVRGRVSEPREVVQGAVIALGQLGDADGDEMDRKIRETLLAIDSHASDTLARNLATLALAEIAGRPGNDTPQSKGRHDIEAALEKRLTRGSTNERPWTALAIGVLGRADQDAKRTPSPQLSRALLHSLHRSKTPNETSANAIAVGMIGLEDALPILRTKLDDMAVESARGYLVLAMGLIGRRDSIGYVKAIAQNARYRPTLLRQAAVSLGLLGDKDLVEDLVGMMAEARGLSTQAAIASALGFIGDSRSVEPLLAMLEDDEEYTDTARGFAAVALGLVADDSDMPWNATFASNMNYRAATPTLNDSSGAGLLNIL